MVFVLLDCFNRFIKRCVIFFPNEIFFNIIILLRLFSIEKKTRTKALKVVSHLRRLNYLNPLEKRSNTDLKLQHFHLFFIIYKYKV